MKEDIVLISDERLARELSKRLDGKFTTQSVAMLPRFGRIPYYRIGYRTLRYDLAFTGCAKTEQLDKELTSYALPRVTSLP